jgi:hypothetical protein
MVRLLRLLMGSETFAAERFNPTMVRLLPEAMKFDSSAPKFQSHNGAIAAVKSTTARLALVDKRVSIPQWCDCCARKLNFHECCLANLRVSIPQWCDCCPNCNSEALPSFNPTMVRLLLTCFRLRVLTPGFNPTMVRLLRAQSGCDSNVRKFQSHNGAIAACPCRPGLISQTKFQSHNGAIAAADASIQACLQAFKFQSHNGAIAAKAKFWDLRAKGKEMVKGLQSTFGCLKTLRGSTATGLSKLGYFGLKLPPHLYLAFKVLKTA